MFLKTTILKRLMKEAYKAYGLTVENKLETWYIKGSTWETEIVKEHIQSDVLGLIVEFAGLMPPVGEALTITPTSNQMHLNGNTVGEFVGKIEPQPTPFSVMGGGTLYRLYQEKDGGKIYMVRNEYCEMTAFSNYEDDKGEEPPEGPGYLGGCLYWWTNQVRFRCNEYTTEDLEERIGAMEGIDL